MSGDIAICVSKNLSIYFSWLLEISRVQDVRHQGAPTQRDSRRIKSTKQIKSTKHASGLNILTFAFVQRKQTTERFLIKFQIKVVSVRSVSLSI